MEIRELIKLGVDRIYNNNFYKQELRRHYKSLFGDNITLTCKNCIDDALFRFKYYLKKSKKEVVMENCLFKLNDNQVIYLASKMMHITNYNLTNELALDLLRMNKKNIKNFKVYPNNWQELLNTETQITIPETLSVEEKQIATEQLEKNVDKLTVDTLVMQNSKDQLIAKLLEYIDESEFKKSDPKYRLAERLLQCIKNHHESSNIEAGEEDQNNGE